MYAIVDIETTGSYAAANGITEVAIYVFDGEKITEIFETLINPGQAIPKYIQAFTGITDEMVAHAPRFEEVAGQVYDLLHHNIFVAHNVNFDYSFLKAHLSVSGYELHSKKLCTVRLGRKIFPGFPSYSLGKFCDTLGIAIKNRHRAGGDAAATVEIFRRLLQHDKENFIGKSLQKNSKEQSLPPNVPKEDFDRLPSSPGVYYFHNEKGRIIYVGKARNIRQRVSSHFSNNSDSRQKQNFLKHTYSISFQKCATELMAIILESTEIRRHWPQFNYSQKHWEDVYGIFTYTDQKGYMRLAIEKNKKNLAPVYSFHYLVEGHSVLRRLITQFSLCPKLCFMQNDHEPCSGNCGGACTRKQKPAVYNRKVSKAIESLSQQPSYAIMDKGLQPEENSCILVLNGKLFGMGYIPMDAAIQHTEAIREYIKPYKENNFIRNLLMGYKAKYPGKILLLKKDEALISHPESENP